MRMGTMRIAGVVLMALAVALTSGTAAFAHTANDNIGRAVRIRDLPFGTTQDTSGATASPRDPQSCIGSDGATVWFEFTPTHDVRVMADTFGSTYDTVLSVFTGGSARSPFALIACNDDSNGLQSVIAFDAIAGTTYRFMVGSYGSGPGGLLHFRAQQAPEIEVSIDSVGNVTRSGDAVIRGTLTCSLPAIANVYVVLEQQSSRRTVWGEGGTGLDCVGEQAWEVVVSGEGAFRAGPASAAAYASGCDPWTYLACDFDDASRGVVLQRFA